MLPRPLSLLPLLLAGAACTPDIGTDPVPEVMQFEPTATPARVPEPSALAINAAGKVDLGLAGIDVPADCQMVAEAVRAQCELNQYLETLDGFPTTASARTPVSAPITDPADLATLTPANVAVVKVVPTLGPGGLVQPIPSKAGTDEVAVVTSADGRYIQVLPRSPWPVGSQIFLGVRGYQNGIRVGGKPVVASTAYNLLKREEPLTCTPTIPAPSAIPADCKFLQLLTQQAPEPAARQSLVTLEGIRRALNPEPPAPTAWGVFAAVGGIPKNEVAVLWTFPVHRASVIDGQPIPAGPDEIRLAVNGPVDPATVSAFRLAEASGSVVLINLSALGAPEPDLNAGFPRASASFADGQIVIKAAEALKAGAFYGIAVTKAARNPAGLSLVPPPLTVLLMARGPVVLDGKITVSALGDLAMATQLEAGRVQLRGLLDNESIAELSGVRREELAYLIAFAWGSP